MEKLLNVSDVKISILKSNPPMLWVSCFGYSNAPNWENIHLSKYEYIVPPKDGLLEFDVVGVPPGKESPQVIYPYLSTPYILEKIPDWFKGVKIYSKTNYLIEESPLFVYGNFIASGYEESLTLEGEGPNVIELTNSFGELQSFREGVDIKCHDNTLLKTPINVEAKVEGKFPNYRFYKRVVYTEIILRVCYPSNLTEEVESKLKDCLNIGLVAAGAIIVAGGVAAALSAFKSAFTSCCLTSIGEDIVKSISVSIDTYTSKGEWRRI